LNHHIVKPFKTSVASVSGIATKRFSMRNSKASVPILGVGDQIGEGDTYLVENILPRELAEVAFESLRKEVAWNTMHHRGAFFSAVLHLLHASRFIKVAKCHDWWQ
jgi:hypothetical protein